MSADGPRSAGVHAAVWDGRDDAGQPVSSGVYLCRMEAGGRSEAMKMLLVKKRHSVNEIKGKITCLSSYSREVFLTSYKVNPQRAFLEYAIFLSDITYPGLWGGFNALRLHRQNQKTTFVSLTVLASFCHNDFLNHRTYDTKVQSKKYGVVQAAP